MNKINEYTEKVFDDIRHVDENGNEYWYARELPTRNKSLKELEKDMIKRKILSTIKNTK